ncbi:PREDICTED: sn1-specific diacylglycerol lipase alpha [Lepidothrix coronata]|uniref:sn-1-specific diacylglycerol lipase n=1 Tax=Lepidothrix coronata TaxID=321398 RepID=A0A6J0J680_9PASS|nr:PREDICTED: sn1-specific diacylglycerol lipase alpha [Lepidothrix coronata]
MPGIVVFRRRWSVGSDDLVLPAVFLFLLHTTWGEASILRGALPLPTVFPLFPAILVIEFVYAIVGIVWLTQYYTSCNDLTAKSVTLGMVVCNWVVILSVCITVLCVFDPTGRTFVKLRATKRRQRNLRTYNLRLDGIVPINPGTEQIPTGLPWKLRDRGVFQGTKTKDIEDAYSEIAYLFAEFFRDLDIVPSDIIAGLVLLRQRQRAKRNAVLDELTLSHVGNLSSARSEEEHSRSFPRVRVLQQEMQRYREVCYYMLFALAAYGWPIYLMRKPTCGLCRLARSCSRCCCSGSSPFPSELCSPSRNKPLECKNSLLLNTTIQNFSSGMWRGLSFSSIPTVARDPPELPQLLAAGCWDRGCHTSIWIPLSSHFPQGMVLSAEYIKKKLEQEMVLSQAFGRDLGRGTKHYGLIVVGHSLGAGTAAILSFLLRPQYPSLKCFAYSPPGGLLSEDAMEYSKEFVTAVVLGKDLVPRIGLSQLEGFRRQLLDVLQRSTKPKWRIIVGATKCIPKSELPEEPEESSVPSQRLWAHPSDLTIALSASTPLYPPGRIIHVVHNHPAEQCCCCEQEDPTYFAIWGDNKAFNEVIISPAMLHEHLPYVVMEGLNKVLENYNKGKTALLSAAKVMVSPTEVDLTPELIFQSQPLPSGPSIQVGTGAIPADRRNSSTKSKSHSEISLEGFYETKPLSPVQKDPVELLLLDTKERLSVELQDRRAPLATMESLSDNESIYSFDSRRSSGFRSIRGSPSLHAVMEKDETHCFYIDPVIPEENPSLSSRTELLAADSLSKHSQETQPPENVLNSGDTTPRRRCSAEGAGSDGERGPSSPREEPALHNGRLADVPSPQVLEFAEFIDSLFNLDSKSSSFQDIYCMMVSDSSSDFAELPKSVSDQEILLRAQYEPNLVPKPPRLFAGSTDPSSGISVSPSFPLSSSGELMDITPTGVSSQECLATDKIRTSTPSGHVTSPAKQDDLMISAL